MVGLLKLTFLVPLALLGLGITPNQGKPLVARVATLTPAPYVATPQQPIVELTYEYVPDAAPVQTTPQEASQAATALVARSNSGGLTGRLGIVSPFGNCVDVPKAIGKNQPGNPNSWRASSFSPFIGAAAIFTFNHTGVVVGIWANGDLEIDQHNWRGGSRIAQSLLRGYF